MNTIAAIVGLADARIVEGECLLQNGHYDASIYITGYAIELLLKAKVCKTLNIPDFFVDSARAGRRNLGGRRLGNQGENLYKPFWVHDYVQLTILSGLYTQIEEAIRNDSNFAQYWSVISFWDESQRYSIGRSEGDAKSFLIAINYLTTWLKQHL